MNINIKELIKNNSLKPADVAKTFGRGVAAPAGTCLVAVDRDTREPLDPIDDNATKELRKRGQVAVDPRNGVEVCKVKQSAEYGLCLDGKRKQNAAHWRSMPGESTYRQPRGVNRRGVPGPLHEFMERALRVALAHRGFEVAESRNPEYVAAQYFARTSKQQSPGRNKRKYYADVLATAGEVKIFFEVVDSSDYLDDDKKRKFIARIAGDGVFVYRITSNRGGRLRSFDLLVSDKLAWGALTQDGEYEQAHYLLLNTGLKLLEEAQYASEIPTHAKTLRDDHEHRHNRPARFEIYEGGKPARDPAANHTKRGKGAGGHEYGRKDERNDRIA